MKYFVKFFISIILFWQFAEVNVYSIEYVAWFRHYGGTLDDRARSIQQISDGGYVVAGDTSTYTYGGADFGIYKLNSRGNKVWFKHYGGTLDDRAQTIQQTSDGGYVVAGDTSSYTYGGADFAIYKLNSSGNKVWFKHYGGIDDDYGRSIQQTTDGGYIVAGYTDSFTYGNNDFAIYKLDSNGNKIWFKHYGGTQNDDCLAIQQTSDGGYIVAGDTNSYTYGSFDFAIYKLDSNGSKVWFKHYGGTENDFCISIKQTSDGGYILAGYTYSYTYGNGDFAIYKLNSSGSKVWFKHYGGSSTDIAYSVQQTSEGGYIVAGYTKSFTHGNADFALYKLNSSGNKTWFKHYGGTLIDRGWSVHQTSDWGYIVAGYSDSYTYGAEDFAIYKLDINGNR